MSMTAGEGGWLSCEMFCDAKGKIKTKFSERKGNKDNIKCTCLYSVLLSLLLIKQNSQISDLEEPYSKCLCVDRVHIFRMFVK